MPTLALLAPFAGWLSAIEEAPDPVFAGRMLGDGVALDPTDAIVRAPCDGQITALPPSGHAVTIRSESGIDVLIHVGIDTVKLGGRGFAVRVAAGDMVTAGEELLRIDFDILARGAASLVTPIVLQGEDITITERRAPGPVKAGERLLVAQRTGPVAAAAAGRVAATRALRMSLLHGLHARPAALLSQRAKALPGGTRLRAHGRSADARSVVALMALGIRHDEPFVIEAEGAGAEAAIERLLEGLEEALRLESAVVPAPPAAQAAVAPARPAAGPGEFAGISAVPGFAVGRATRLERRTLEVAETGGSPAHEALELERAQADVRSRLARMAGTGGATRREIIKAHLEFVEDPQLNAVAQVQIAAGKSAAFAWRMAVRESIATLELLDDPRLRERADDLLDIENHVLMALMGEARPLILPLPEHAVLLAADLLPSELTALDRSRIVAICLGRGGATSHVSILAAAMEIPMLIGLGAAVHQIADGTTVVVDADAGLLVTTPTESVVATARRRVADNLNRSAEQRHAAQAECFALDGTRVEVFANLGNAAEATVAIDNGAEGCGLLRTEFLFIDRDDAPGEDEQYHAYQQIAAALGARPLILRLMDVGGDKPLRYLPLPHEDNPALGLRGVRTILARPDLMRTQIAAALRVQPAGRVRLLLPMVTDVAEVVALRAVIDELRGAAGVPPVDIGAMIETPAAALTAAQVIREVDFLSIGSNDLTQYTLAMDRGHPQLAARTDALHPAVLRLIAATGAAGLSAGKLVAVCGGVAADRLAVPLLLGLGVRELSVVPGAIPATKARVRALNILECRDVALRCLDLASAADVRTLVTQFLSGRGDHP